MVLSGRVGEVSPTSSQSSNTVVDFPFDNTGSPLVSELHGRYYSTTYRRHNYVIANQAVVTTTAALATTWTGLLVGNPTTSTVNLVINYFTCAQVAVGAAAAVGIMTGTGASVTASLTPRNRYVGGAASQAFSNAGQTLPGTPVLEQVFGSIGSLATTGYGLQNGIYVDLGGSLILPPGAFVATYTTIATTSSLIFSFGWEEIPI